MSYRDYFVNIFRSNYFPRVAVSFYASLYPLLDRGRLYSDLVYTVSNYSKCTLFGVPIRGRETGVEVGDGVENVYSIWRARKGGGICVEGTAECINRFVPIHEIGSPSEYTICMNDWENYFQHGPDNEGCFDRQSLDGSHDRFNILCLGSDTEAMTFNLTFERGRHGFRGRETFVLCWLFRKGRGVCMNRRFWKLRRRGYIYSVRSR